MSLKDDINAEDVARDKGEHFHLFWLYGEHSRTMMSESQYQEAYKDWSSQFVTSFSPPVNSVTL